MKLLHFLLIVVLLPILVVGCEEDKPDYNPEISDVFDLEQEYKNLNTAVNSDIEQISECLSKEVFNRYYGHMKDVWQNIDLLLDKGEELLKKEETESGIRQRLVAVNDKMQASKKNWELLFSQFTDIKKTDVELLLSFNYIKAIVLNPSFSYDRNREVLSVYNLLIQSEELPRLTYISERVDYDFIMNFGKEILNIDKVYDFARVTSRSLIFKNDADFVAGQLDSLQIVRGGLNNEKNNKELYDWYIKPTISFSITGKIFDYEYMHLFNTNSRNLNKLLLSYKYIASHYNTFTTYFNQYSDTISYAAHLENINSIDDAENLFNAIYADSYSDFSEMKTFALLNDDVLLWKKTYLNWSNSISTLHAKYEGLDSVDDVNDIDLIASLDSTSTQLYDEFVQHEEAYTFFFYLEIRDLIDDNDEDNTSFKLLKLKEKIKN